MKFKIKYICFLSGITILLLSCNIENKKIMKNNNIDVEDEKIIIEYLQEDYTRSDLLYIMGIGSYEGEISCTWKVSLEELVKLKEQTLQELINTTNMERLIKNSNYFINNAFGNMYTNRMYFHSIDYITVNNKKYGEDTNTKRNDWIIIISYKTYDSDFNEKVFVLPDYRIIISSNNFEGIH